MIGKCEVEKVEKVRSHEDCLRRLNLRRRTSTDRKVLY